MADPLKTVITNPLDALFNTPPHVETTVDEYISLPEGMLQDAEAEARASAEQLPPEKDAEDIEIDGKIDQVYDAAIDAFQTQTAYMEVIEPRYAARNAEVAAGYLTIALNAATAKAKVKSDRKRNQTFVPFSNQNRSPDGTVIASRDQIMKLINDGKFGVGDE